MPRPILRPTTSADERRRPRSRGRLLAVVAVLLVVLAGSAAPAAAHASLLSTNPPDDSVLDAAPSEVSLTFTEGVQVQPDGVRVLSADGTRVDQGAALASGSTVSAPVRSGLPDGGYVVAWRVVSSDGHPINGAFRFSIGVRTAVGDDVLQGAFSASADSRDEWAGRVLRALTYLAVLGVSGAVLVGAALRRDDEPSPVTRLVGGLAGLGILAAAAQLPFQASLVSGMGLGSVTDQPVLELALADGFGVSLLMVSLGLLAVVLTTGLAFRTAVRATATVGAVAAPLGLVLTGHTRTMSPAGVAYLADAVHVLAGAVWFGGLLSLGATLTRRQRDDDLAGAADAVRRFSGLAMVSAGLVVVAGVVLGWLEVRGLRALVDTDYGRLLLVKAGLVGLVLVGAAWNRFRFVPSLTAPGAEGPAAEDLPAVELRVVTGSDDEGDRSVEAPSAPASPSAPAWGRFRTVLRAEVVGIVAVLAVTGVLSNLTPARAAVEQGSGTATAPFGSGTIDVQVTPGAAGRNDVHVYVFDENELLDDTYETVSIALLLPAQDLGPIELEPVRAGPGHFQVVNTDIPLAGEWTVTVTARPDRFTEQAAEVVVTLR